MKVCASLCRSNSRSAVDCRPIIGRKLRLPSIIGITPDPRMCVRSGFRKRLHNVVHLGTYRRDFGSGYRR
jgi:hypothetical protein